MIVRSRANVCRIIQTFFVFQVMKKRKQVKCIHVGKYAASVDVELIEAEDEWAPYLLLGDVYKLDDVREALRIGDLKAASQKARVSSCSQLQFRGL